MSTPLNLFIAGVGLASFPLHIIPALVSMMTERRIVRTQVAFTTLMDARAADAADSQNTATFNASMQLLEEGARTRARAAVWSDWSALGALIIAVAYATGYLCAGDFFLGALSGGAWLLAAFLRRKMSRRLWALVTEAHELSARAKAIYSSQQN